MEKDYRAIEEAVHVYVHMLLKRTKTWFRDILTNETTSGCAMDMVLEYERWRLVVSLPI